MIPSKPHFFQPLLPGFEDQFSIPVAFYDNYFNGGKNKGGGDKTVVLTTRSGKFPTVRVSGREFKDGWKEFVKAHDLHVGDFLVFRLDADMVFHVMVFDPTVCERQYHQQQQQQQQQQKVSSAPPKPNQAPAAAAGHVLVKTEVEETQIPAVEEEANNGDFHLETPGEKNVNGDKASLGAKEVGPGLPNNPFFVFTVGKDVVLKHRVYVPKKIARQNGLAGKCCETIVMDEEGRPWPARFASYQSTICVVQMGLSWKEFQRANGVEMGDVLKVELVQCGMKPIFRMSGSGMRRMEKEAKQEPVREDSPAAAAGVSSRDCVNVEGVRAGLKSAFKVPDMNPKRDAKIMEEVKQEPVHEQSAAPTVAAESSKDRSSYFTVRLTEGYLKGGFLNIPQEFAVKNGLHGTSLSMLLANAAGTPFLVELKTTKAGTPYIGTGWRDVVVTNQLRMGDVLRFELVESGPNPVMNFKVVAIWKGQGGGSSVN